MAFGRRKTGAPPPERKARVYVTRIDPWSVLKVAFMISVGMAIMIVVAVTVLWWVLDATGVLEAFARTVDEVVGGGSTTFDLRSILSFTRVVGAATMLSAVEIVLVSVVASLFSVLYNLTVSVTGGIEVTMSDDDA